VLTEPKSVHGKSVHTVHQTSENFIFLHLSRFFKSRKGDFGRKKAQKCSRREHLKRRVNTFEHFRERFFWLVWYRLRPAGHSSA
jgi:hypothetical protein